MIQPLQSSRSLTELQVVLPGKKSESDKTQCKLCQKRQATLCTRTVKNNFGKFHLKYFAITIGQVRLLYSVFACVICTGYGK